MHFFCSFFSAARRTDGGSAAAVTGLIARAATPHSGAAELALLKQSSPSSLIRLPPLLPDSAVLLFSIVCFNCLMRGLLLCRAFFCSFFSAARRTNGGSAAAVTGLIARGRFRGAGCAMSVSGCAIWLCRAFCLSSPCVSASVWPRAEL